MSLEIMQSSTPHNMAGLLGPRCPVCSGLGRYLALGLPGRPTRDSTRCVCGGTGVDRELVREREMSSLLTRLATLEKRAHRQATALRELRSQTGLKGTNSRQSWEELIAWATADGTAIANTTTEGVLFPGVLMPGNYLSDGRAMGIDAYGKLSTTATPTMTWALRYGPAVTGVLLATTEAITMGSGVANVNWTASLKIQTRANGATGSLLAFGTLHVHTAVGTVLTNIFSVSGFDAPAAVTCDLTAETTLSLTGDWSAASASNTATGMIFNLESLN